MKNEFSMSWNRSIQARKQRKFRFNAPLHIKQKFISAHLSKELRKKYQTRSLVPKKGDKVMIMRGQHRKKSGKIEKTNLKMSKVYVAGIESVKKDGTKNLIPLEPSNIMITELNMNDKERQKILQRKMKNQSPVQQGQKVEKQKKQKKE